jgi:polyhydroxyalkanoate synthase
MGPRPLPLHLVTHALTLLGSHAALPSLKNGSLSWKPHLAPLGAPLAAEVQESLASGGAEAAAAFESALTDEAFRRHEAFLAGINAYRAHSYHRALPPSPVVWSQGSTRLLDYRMPGVVGGVPVLVVPSLINRAYVLDLTGRRSLIRYLAEKGLAPFLVDWDAPGEAERNFTLDDYICGRLESALDVVTALTGARPAVLGYCMGGLLALALVQRRPEAVRSMVLMATPWDFAAGREAHALMMRALAEPMSRIIETAGAVPVDMLQAMFASLDPGLTPRKFAAFARVAPDSARAREFVALEDWANDGVPLAGNVACQCLFGWYGANDPAEGRWCVAGQPVKPEDVRTPTLLLVPERDRIVPPVSALALANKIVNGKLMMVKGGHVGMLSGPRAKTEVYGPIAKWLVRLG